MSVNAKCSFATQQYEKMLMDKYFIKSFYNKEKHDSLFFSIIEVEGRVTYSTPIECYDELVFPVVNN